MEPEADVHLPRLRYRVIDKGDHDSRDLERRRSLTALLLWLEKNRTPQALKKMIPRLTAMLSRTRDLPLSQAFLAWFHATLDVETTGAVPELRNLEEFRGMLQDTIERWRKEIRAEGRAQGERAGERKGEANVLLRQLERKFGPLDSKVRSRVRKAGAKRLEEWTERILSAQRLEDVFEA